MTPSSPLTFIADCDGVQCEALKKRFFNPHGDSGMHAAGLEQVFAHKAELQAGIGEEIVERDSSSQRTETEIQRFEEGRCTKEFALDAAGVCTRVHI